ncbi:tRNA-dihydrouridine(47) synthase [NAD(P)(+)]-like isoform X2 [Athalia rosae]|uniref:tRNA-dihydrouridine(47) synthase [NAD(P)(+)]-like isoform X2 n=1 Tax=Athalia rosae TaxID=37344 RepID=UPI002033F793|nr:tRNA-dihydrouridine(47) synthase [NAD(P)(+)]-like isoform X2 [Athalia rosae]XP_048511192.1 tRNA-dihydrouridine(47) synthase [NAD(P)(+)]-like isoform X2 [Athalia rosae]XP_048511232.1 tRNA-dihydrouridine(47) synthase [NAD(P)(+)]-like isoform X2 [Athalia rosae]
MPKDDQTTRMRIYTWTILKTQRFIVKDHVRLLAEECLTEADKEKVALQLNDSVIEESGEELGEQPLTKKPKFDDKKDKLRGQNKARAPPYKPPRDANICPWLVDQAVGEPERKCDKRCQFMHDRAEYLKIKPPDIAEKCFFFERNGRCPRGVACRMGGMHLTESGLNIVDEEKFEEYKKKPPATKNQLPKDLQNKIRKHAYNFSRAEKIVKANDAARKNRAANVEDKIKNVTLTADENIRAETNGNLSHTGLDDDSKVPLIDNSTKFFKDSSLTKEEPKLGPVSDYDTIKELPSEKRQINWKDKILLSPLTTVGNLPFRRICKEYGADFTCGEMALAPKLLKGANEEWALVKRHESEDVFGVQICGNNPGVLARCAQMLEDEIEVDFIDLNLGCPIDLIYRQGGGSGMLNKSNVLEITIKSISQVLSIPLTVKTRMGVYMDKPVAHNLTPKFRDWGASMITVHGRSREQRYTRMADWQYIEKCAAAAKPIPIYGNGDILSFEDYQTARETCPSIQGVTIGRGALIKPWIFNEIKEQKILDISSSERFEIIKKYVNYGLEHWGSDTRGVETTRRFTLEWMSFLHRYIPVGILERPPQKINERPPYFRGRDDMETLLASSNCADWIKISEMLLGRVPEGFHFLPKHKANSWK